MSVAIQETFGVGTYWTTRGQKAVVDAVLETGELLGRVNIQTDETRAPHWYGVVWKPSGRDSISMYVLVKQKPTPAISKIYWLNIYPSGPGLLRKTWEEALIEASRSEEEVLARTQVKVEARVGEGLK